jgi:hypothetical protein
VRVALAARGKRGADGCGVDLPHKLADVLALAGAGGAGLDPARRADGIAERLGETERIELGIAQADELLAEILRGVSGALALALARPVGRVFLRRVVWDVRGHGCSNGLVLVAARMKFCPIFPN